MPLYPIDGSSEWTKTKKRTVLEVLPFHILKDITEP